MVACEKSGENTQGHFAQVSEMVSIGSGASREMDSYALSRYACYLIVQNGDPHKFDNKEYSGAELENVKILGKAVAFQSDVR